MIYGYARCSTNESKQDINRQVRELKEAGAEEKERLENIEELISAAVEYENNSETPSLTGFLEEVALVSDVDKYDETADAVVMMTIRSAKGLEFPVVFLPGMEEGLFPGLQSLNFPDEIEEERRLAYVAVTRAQKRLLITHVKERMLYGRTQYNQLSRFVKEIPDTLIESEDRVSAFGSNEAMVKRRIVFEESARPELVVKNKINSYQFVGNCDALITDYSSIYFDYLLCDKPIGAVWEDIEEYRIKPGFCTDIDYYMQGANKIYNLEDLSKFIQDLSKNIDNLKEERNKICKEVNYSKDGNNTKRVVDFIIDKGEL